MVRVTYSLDDATVAEIRRIAARLRRPQSQIVREAIAEYGARADQLSAGERVRLLGVLSRLREAPPTRPASAVDAELRALRTTRRRGGRRHPA
jgi:ribbon-helix-helix CopG family protein